MIPVEASIPKVRTRIDNPPVYWMSSQFEQSISYYLERWSDVSESISPVNSIANSIGLMVTDGSGVAVADVICCCKIENLYSS